MEITIITFIRENIISGGMSHLNFYFTDKSDICRSLYLCFRCFVYLQNGIFADFLL